MPPHDDRLDKIADDTAYLRGQWDEWQRTRQCTQHDRRIRSIERLAWKMVGVALVGSLLASTTATALAGYLFQ